MRKALTPFLRGFVYLQEMHKEYIEIDSTEIRKQMNDCGLTQSDLAARLKVSTKTIQRWLNQSIKRVEVKTLQRLAQVLEVPTESLAKKREPVRPSGVNKSFEELCSNQVLFQVMMNDDWRRFETLLKVFNPKDLSSGQEAWLYMILGMTCLHTGRLKSAKVYLDRAVELARSTGNARVMIMASLCLGVRSRKRGDIASSKVHLYQIEKYLPQVDKELQCMFNLHQARTLLYSGAVQEGIRLMRQALANYYRTPQANMFFVAHNYVFLIWAYLGQRDFANARISVKRMAGASQKGAWVKGQSIAFMMQGILELDSSRRLSFFGRGRAMKKVLPNSNNWGFRGGQLDFLYAIHSGDIEGARRNVHERLTHKPTGYYYFGHAVLDALFLEKLQPGSLKLRKSQLLRATEIFKRAKNTEAQRVIHELMDRERISLAEFCDLYIY